MLHSEHTYKTPHTYLLFHSNAILTFQVISLGKVNGGLVLVKEKVIIQTEYPCLNKKWNR